ncbi:MAG TPA: hypothetical protein VIL74_05665 [Pyrinomonadaceae bacterium]|jgi:hypothetical protein
MKKAIFLILILSSVALAQSARRYEAEMLKNPNEGGKDTREVNAVLIFEKNSLKIDSRRKKETFKEIDYASIKHVEHSYSKTPLSTFITRSTVLTLLLADDLYDTRKEKHWLTILTEDDFVVLKIENDNYRLLRNEFLIRKLDVQDVNEDR